MLPQYSSAAIEHLDTKGIAEGELAKCKTRTTLAQ